MACRLAPAHRVITIGDQDGRHAYGVTASPDGTTLASLDPTESAIDLRDRATGRLRGTLSAPGPISPFVPLQFSPDGGRLVAVPASGGSKCWIWDISRSGLFTEFEPPIDPPVARVFLVVGGRFCTVHGGVDGSPAKVVLWKLDPHSSSGPQLVARFPTPPSMSRTHPTVAPSSSATPAGSCSSTPLTERYGSS